MACLIPAAQTSIRPETPHGASLQARTPRTSVVAARVFSECRQPGRPSPRRWRRSLEVIDGNPVSATAPARAAPGGRAHRRSGFRAFASRCSRSSLITTGSLIHAMIRTAPPQAGQTSMSVPQTASERKVHVCPTTATHPPLLNARSGPSPINSCVYANLSGLSVDKDRAC